VFDVARKQEEKREGDGVYEVVHGGAEADVGQEAEHGEVRGEEEDGEEEPAVVEVLVGEDGEDDESGFFKVEEDAWLREH